MNYPHYSEAWTNIPQSTKQTTYHSAHKHGETTLKIWANGQQAQGQDATYVIKHFDGYFRQIERNEGPSATQINEKHTIQDRDVTTTMWRNESDIDGRTVIERLAEEYGARVAEHMASAALETVQQPFVLEEPPIAMGGSAQSVVAETTPGHAA